MEINSPQREQSLDSYFDDEAPVERSVFGGLSSIRGRGNGRSGVDKGEQVDVGYDFKVELNGRFWNHRELGELHFPQVGSLNKQMRIVDEVKIARRCVVRRNLKRQ